MAIVLFQFLVYCPNIAILLSIIPLLLRKKFFMHCSSKILFPNQNPNCFAFFLPSIHFTPANILSWVKLRSILRDLGMRFYRRVEVYFGLMLVLYLCTLLLVLLTVFKVVELPLLNASFGSLMIFWGFIMCTVFLQVVYVGASINYITTKQRVSLIGIRSLLK